MIEHKVFVLRFLSVTSFFRELLKHCFSNLGTFDDCPWIFLRGFISYIIKFNSILFTGTFDDHYFNFFFM